MHKIVLIIALLILNVAFGNVTLPSVFSDHMVLQQQDDVKFWGWAEPNEEVIIKPSWTQDEYKVKTDNHANWKLVIKTPKAGGPYSIIITGYNQIILKDVLIGEVWLCSGQSNMEMSASWGIKNEEAEIKRANYPNIRFFKVPKMSSDFPQNDVQANWTPCTPETMKYNSALAYFFAEKMQTELPDVPIGLVISSWGATPAEVWMPEETITNDSILLESANKIKPNEYCPIKPASTFNAMIHPLVGFNIAGVLWYQGESNVGYNNYELTFSALINSWRQLWEKKFPFYFVQIAPYNYGGDKYSGVIVRNAQRKVAQAIEKTAMVVTSDISTVDDIHPKDKKSVGIRLADLALKNHYKVLNYLVEGPILQNIKYTKNKAHISFKYAEGLHFKDKKSLFEIAGVDKNYYPASFKLKNGTIVISSQKVKSPKYVRYAWGNNIQSNLFNKANLPTSSFITED